MENNENNKNVNNENNQNNNKPEPAKEKAKFNAKRILIDIGLVTAGAAGAIVACYFVGASKMKNVGAVADTINTVV